MIVKTTEIPCIFRQIVSGWLDGEKACSLFY